MKVKKVVSVAARMLKVGVSKVWVDPVQSKRVGEAMTKEDVKELIAQRVIRKRQDALHSRARARWLRMQKRKGRRRGHGRRSGLKSARMGKKRSWIARVRAQRAKLKELRSTGKVDSNAYGVIYKQIKGNHFKGKKYVEEAVLKGLNVKRRV
ncbi:MAG: 50S ribosomal protein L19e [Candidatus Diapherotrites archaeon]|nr:50S ribosomal protein L19e [Candidatus Diapherotrites archaeon]